MIGIAPCPAIAGSRPDTPNPVPGPTRPSGALGTGAPPPTCTTSSGDNAGSASASAVKSLISRKRSMPKCWRTAEIENDQWWFVICT